MGDKNGDGFVKWFSELSNKNISIAGGKGASLAEMYNHKFPIPPGFVVTAQAYSYFIEKTGIGGEIHRLLDKLDVEDTKALNEASKKVRALIEGAKLPEEMGGEIVEAYEILDVNRKNIAQASGGALDILKRSYESPFVAVRSSATTEDLADASFAGQQETFLNIKGEAKLLQSVKKCFSSLFTPRAVYYRTKKGFAHDKSYLAVVVQMMVDSDKSGVMFSKNPIKNDNTLVIEAVWGLGEGIVSGMIKPDNYVLDRSSDELKIKSTEVSEKKIAIVRDSSGENKTVKLTPERAMQQVLDAHELKVLASYGLRLEEHYGKPQDIEFAIAGKEIFIVQSRPITTKASESTEEIIGKVLLSGLGASPGVSSGGVKIIHDLHELGKIKKGDVLVTEMTNPDMVVSMQKAAGIITDEGGITSHAAIVSREMGIPAVVGTGKATSELTEGMIVTVDGNNGKVYEGKGERQEAVINPIVPTKTKIKVIVDLPGYAERAALSGAKAIGLVRLEGIIATSGKHPLHFVKRGKMNEYEEIIYSGLKKIAEHFEEIWVRTSDIRSDEFRHLEGAVEEVEGNPMLGDHGVRFSLRHRDIMKSEVTAMKRLAEGFKDKKIGIMVPQVISVEELRETKEIAKEAGVGKNVHIGIMVETPAAVQIINELCEEGLSFVSFGTNDLTQYTLAIDRNNENVQYLYNEMHPAVLNSLRYVIRRCKKYGVETSICGQAGSKEEMAKFLLQEGIDSISVNADAAEKVSKLVASMENPSSKKFEGHSNNEEMKRDVELRENMEEVKEEESKEKSLGETEITPIQQEIDEKKRIGVSSPIPDEDIEKIILKELESGYAPGNENPKAEIPSLNDSMPLNENES